MSDTPVRAIRIPDQEVEQALEKAKDYGVMSLSAVVRLALKKLKKPRKE